MSSAKWKILPFETAVQSRGAGSSGLAQKEWLAQGKFPIIGQGAEDIEGWTDREDLLLTPAPAVVLYGGHTRRAKHVSQPFVPGPNVKILQPSSAIDSKFLFYFLTYLPIESKGYADHFPLVRKCDVPVPPLPEQQRIVGILDEAFEGIATAKANAEKNVQNARELYASVLENLFTDSVDDCETVEFGELIDTLTDYHANGSYEVLKQNVELRDTEDFAWMVRSTDFEKDFRNEMRYITKAAYDFLTKSRIFGGEIIMSKIGNAGKVYLMPEITRPCSLAMNLFLIRLNEDRASNKYVYRYLKSKRGEAQILAKLKGVATQTITKESVRSLRIPLLPRDIQDRFVSKLENVEAETQRLEAIYRQKLADLDELKKTVLQKAFNGELAEVHP